MNTQQTVIELVRGWYNGLTPNAADYDDFSLNCEELRDAEIAEGGGNWDIPTQEQFEDAVSELLAK